MLAVPDDRSYSKFIESRQAPFLYFLFNVIGIFRQVEVKVILPGVVGETEPGYLFTGQQSVGKKVDV